MKRDEHFSCVIQRDEDGKITRIEISVEHLDGTPRCAAVNGYRAGLVSQALHDILRDGGIAGRQWSGRRPIPLDQTTGAQTWLLLTTTKALRRADRLEEVSEGVASMSREEASYWYAKAQRPRGLRAVRLLLSSDGRRQ